MHNFSFVDAKSIYMSTYDYLRSLLCGPMPLFRLFRTQTKGYLYDTGTNHIFACSDLEFAFLDYLTQHGLSDIVRILGRDYSENEILAVMEALRSQIEEAGILKARNPIRFGGAHFENLGDSMQNSVGMLQLEVTDRCNLRCAYCLYNPHYDEKRNHGNRDMTVATAFRAIERFAQNSKFRSKVGITFYGGEPLLAFSLIKSCIRYAKKILAGREIVFSITTNGTLFTEEMVNYLAAEGVGINVSIDGPEAIHDEHRRECSGKGSFQRTIKALRMLFEAYGDKTGRLSLSMVYTPPYSLERISQMAELWEQFPWLPKHIGVSVSYAVGFNPGGNNRTTKVAIDFSLLRWAGLKFIQNYEKGEKPHPMAAGVIERELARIMTRPLSTGPPEYYFLNGCCVPAVRKQFVTVDGQYTLCERIGMVPAIGDLENGINLNMVESNYVEDYAEKSLPLCSTCWALRLCSICYLHSYKKGVFDIQEKGRNCEIMRESRTYLLSLFCRLLEIDNSGLDYLSEMTIS